MTRLSFLLAEKSLLQKVLICGRPLNLALTFLIQSLFALGKELVVYFEEAGFVYQSVYYDGVTPVFGEELGKTALF